MQDENSPPKHDRLGLLSVANAGADTNGSQVRLLFMKKNRIGSEREACGFTEGRVESVDSSSLRRKSLNGSTAGT